MGEQDTSLPALRVQTAPAQIRRAVADAARKTQVDFDFLLAQAQVESGGKSDARARTSSAAGLFQFIESTWLQTLHRHGAEMGLGDYAAQISISDKGAIATDPAARQALLNLRFDPRAASLMAGALANDNRDALIPVLGREPQAGELYLAHFLGAGGATKFLSLLADDPDQPAAAAFSGAAAANRPIFYNASGHARSLGEVMSLVNAKISRAMEQGGGTGAFATGEAIVSTHSGPKSQWQAQRNAFQRGDAAGQGGADIAVPTRPISQILQAHFTAGGGAGDGGAGGPDGAQADHVRRAYAQLKAFGL